MVKVPKFTNDFFVTFYFVMLYNVQKLCKGNPLGSPTEVPLDLNPAMLMWIMLECCV
jgi:hypothetical protein